MPTARPSAATSKRTRVRAVSSAGEHVVVRDPQPEEAALPAPAPARLSSTISKAEVMPPARRQRPHRGRDEGAGRLEAHGADVAGPARPALHGGQLRPDPVQGRRNGELAREEQASLGHRARSSVAERARAVDPRLVGLRQSILLFLEHGPRRRCHRQRDAELQLCHRTCADAPAGEPGGPLRGFLQEGS